MKKIKIDDVIFIKSKANLDKYKHLLSENEKVELEFANDIQIFVITNKQMIAIDTKENNSVNFNLNKIKDYYTYHDYDKLNTMKFCTFYDGHITVKFNTLNPTPLGKIYEIMTYVKAKYI